MFLQALHSRCRSELELFATGFTAVSQFLYKNSRHRRIRFADRHGRRERQLADMARTIFLVFALIVIVPLAAADGGPLGIDHRLSLDNDGPWQTRNQRAVLGVVGVAVGATALWEGSDTRMGKTAWQSIDAAVLGTVAAEGLKRVFTRERPAETDDPDRWFKGHSNHSFPSGETTAMAAMVTPLVLEYRHDYPAVYAMEILPVFTAISRMKVQAHWQTDVLAGLALGSGLGYVTHSLPIPLSVMILPRGITAGFKARF
jgi:undecaprenyl-diphosphatase